MGIAVAVAAVAVVGIAVAVAAVAVVGIAVVDSAVAVVDSAVAVVDSAVAVAGAVAVDNNLHNTEGFGQNEKIGIEVKFVGHMLGVGNYSHHKHLTLRRRCGSLEFLACNGWFQAGGSSWTQAGGRHTHNSGLALGQFSLWRNPNAGVAGGPSSLSHDLGARFGPHNTRPGSTLDHAGSI